MFFYGSKTTASIAPAVRAAAEAANRNLELVTDAYQRGTFDIVRVIDAQNQAVTNDLAAANAVYDYLIDVLRTEHPHPSLVRGGDAPPRRGRTRRRGDRGR